MSSKKYLILSLFSILIFGCVNDTNCKPDITFSNQSLLPINGFVKIEQTILKNKISFVHYNASGFIFEQKNNKTFILTAKHLCEMEKEFALNDPKTLDQFFTVFNINLEKHIAIVKKKDKIYDICILEVDGIVGEKMKLSNKEPKLGDKIVNIAAPGGIFDFQMMPILDGRYSGLYLSQYGMMMSMYSLPVAHGSSGSPVLNDDGEVIGLVVSLNRDFSNVGMGIPLFVLKEFTKTVE